MGTCGCQGGTHDAGMHLGWYKAELFHFPSELRLMSRSTVKRIREHVLMMSTKFWNPLSHVPLPPAFSDKAITFWQPPFL